MRQALLRRPFLRYSAAAFALAALVSACSGGGSVLSPQPPSKAPTPSPTPAGATASGTLTTSTTGSTSITIGPFAGGYSATITVPAASAVAHLQITLSLTEPPGVPTVMSARRRPQNVNAANINAFAYIGFTPDTNVTLPDSFIVTWSFPVGVQAPDPSHSYVAIYDPNNPANPNNPAAGWTLVTGPATTFINASEPGTNFIWPPPSTPLILVANAQYELALFSTTSTLATPTPLPTTTATATASPRPSPTATGSPTATPVPTPTASTTATPRPTATPTTSPTPTASPRPTATPTHSPSPTPSPTPTGFIVESATGTGNGVVDIPQTAGSTGAFTVLADDNTTHAFPNGQIVVNLAGLPLTGEICQIVPSNGQCMAPPVSTINPFPESFSAGESEEFSIFLTSEGMAINNGTVTVTFEDSTGATIGSTSVTVLTTN